MLNQTLFIMSYFSKKKLPLLEKTPPLLPAKRGSTPELPQPVTAPVDSPCCRYKWHVNHVCDNLYLTKLKL